MNATKRFTSTTYDAGNGYFVDIVEDSKKLITSAWLYNEDIGIKECMFGAMESTTRTLELVEANIDEYIKDYELEGF